MTFEDELLKIFGKFIWILDDFRINFNYINVLHKDFIRKTSINSLNILNKSRDPNPKKRLFKKKSKTKISFEMKPINKGEDIKELINNPRYSELEKLLVFDKMEYINKYQRDCIENAYLFGTQSDFIYRSAFIYVITLYEGFNDKIFELLEKFKPLWFVNEKSGKKIKYNSNIDILTENFRDRYKLFNLETEFDLFNKLRYNYYLRHIIVHNLGIIDKKFTESVGNHTQDIDKKVIVSKEIFNSLVDILLRYFIFMKNTLTEKKDLIQN